jgi:plasmid stabilization system protein ParE
MAYDILETQLAAQDLEHIVTYIADSLANPMAASAFLDAVADCYDGLACTPLMYGFCHDPQLRKLGYHKAVIKHYVMVFKVDEAAKQVYILRFFYGRQDYEKLI